MTDIALYPTQQEDVDYIINYLFNVRPKDKIFGSVNIFYLRTFMLYNYRVPGNDFYNLIMSIDELPHKEMYRSTLTKELTKLCADPGYRELWDAFFNIDKQQEFVTYYERIHEKKLAFIEYAQAYTVLIDLYKRLTRGENLRPLINFVDAELKEMHKNTNISFAAEAGKLFEHDTQFTHLKQSSDGVFDSLCDACNTFPTFSKIWMSYKY